MADRTAIETQSASLPVCPHLPEAPDEMSWRSINVLGTDRGSRFFLRSLEYGHYLWQRGLAARAILSVDRALLANVSSGDPVFLKHPLPYRALAWMIARAPIDAIVGNPRVHYQHLADRVRGERAEQRSWRAWAMWHVSRVARPEFPADPRHEVDEPSISEIRTGLKTFGVEHELAWWEEACEEAGTREA